MLKANQRLFLSYYDVRRLLCMGLVIMTLLTRVTKAQLEGASCRESPSIQRDLVDVHCRCMQMITQLSSFVHELYLDQTDCSRVCLKLDWGVMQDSFNLSKVVVRGADLNLMQSADLENMQFSVTDIEFDNCTLESLSSDSFKGLNAIRTIKIHRSHVGRLMKGAFGDFDHLSLVEFLETTIDRVQSHAFTDLPALFQIAFVSTTIEKFETDAVQLELPKGESGACRARRGGRRAFESVMARMLEFEKDTKITLESVKLPDDGAQLVFLNATINELQSKAVRGDGLAYVIVGASEIGKLSTHAFDVHLGSDCDVASLLLIATNIHELQQGALKAVAPRPKNPENTVVAVHGNTFDLIEEGGFLVSDKLVTPPIAGQNSFSCNCDGFEWLRSEVDSKIQTTFNIALVEFGRCILGETISDFLKTCDNDFRLNRTKSATLPSDNSEENEIEPDASEHVSSSPPSVYCLSSNVVLYLILYATKVLVSY